MSYALGTAATAPPALAMDPTTRRMGPMPTTPPSPGYHWEIRGGGGRSLPEWYEARTVTTVSISPGEPIPLGLPGGTTKLEAEIHRDLAYPMVVLSTLGGAAAGHVLGRAVGRPKLGAILGGVIAGLYALTATKA